MKFAMKHWLAVVSGSALVGAFVAPAPAYAHCGGHADSCGQERDEFDGNWCDVWYRGYISAQYHHYGPACSGTCYNSGTAGCCDSPAACADAPCKPGGCGGDCYMYSWSSQDGPSAACGFGQCDGACNDDSDCPSDVPYPNHCVGGGQYPGSGYCACNGP